MQLTAFCKPAMSYCFADHDRKFLLAQQHAAMPSCVTKPEPYHPGSDVHHLRAL